MITDDMIEDVKWYTGITGGTGIVLVNTGFGYKAYIGVMRGISAEADALYIAQTGAKFYEGPKLWPNKTWWADLPETKP